MEINTTNNLRENNANLNVDKGEPKTRHYNSKSKHKKVRINYGNKEMTRVNRMEENKITDTVSVEKDSFENKSIPKLVANSKAGSRLNVKKANNNQKKKLRVIPLGGLEEIGKNMTLFEYGEDILVVDCGLAFPEDEMLGIDLVIPDFSYLEANKDKVKGVVVTHGHEDHIGALPYFLKKVNVPVYATELTVGLIQNKLIEHKLVTEADLKVIKAGQTIDVGVFKVEFIRSTHSIADAVALAIDTPVGTVLHTGDFKIDYTPIEGDAFDLARFAQLGKKGILLLMADSTNVERQGYTLSESTLRDAFEDYIKDEKRRIIFATFASNVHRVQQVINAAHKFGKKVALCGRSMINVVNVAIELGYISNSEGVIVDIDQLKKIPPEQTVILTTGSQGEPMSALTRMASATHRKVEIADGDLVIISATPIPGNEKTVSRVVNELFKKGAEVIYDATADIHVSGHACREELKIIHKLVSPRYFMPVHGEYRHLKHHAKLAEEMGVKKENIFIMETGRVLELGHRTAMLKGNVQAGSIMVDGLGVGDVGSIVLRDRKILSEEGLIVVVLASNKNGDILTAPEIYSRGFVYVKESEGLMEEIREVTSTAIEQCRTRKRCDKSMIKNRIKDSLGSFLYEKTGRRPMILSVVAEIKDM